MPLYSDDTATRSFLPLEEIPSTFSEVIGAQFDSTLTELPSVAGKRLYDLAQARTHGTTLPKADALARIESTGLAGHLNVDDNGITEAALGILMERKQEELRIASTMARARGGFGEGAARLGVALGTSLLDPVNVGMAFVPIVGQARYARILGQAGGAFGRAGVRAGVGAAEGVAGAAIIEPLIYSAKQQEQADYEMADSLMNLAFGTIFGGGLHVVGGAGADAVRAWRGQVPIDVPEAAAEIRGVSLIPRAETLPAAERAIEARFAQRVESDIDGAIAQYGQLADSEGGRILNTDLARELSSDYRADRTRSAAVHEPASYLVKRMYERKLAEAPSEGQDAHVLFSAGGTGAGKSTSLERLASADEGVARAQIIYDTNMNTLSSSARKIEQALQADKRVTILYTWRDPVDALVNGALPRAMDKGRTVPITEHAQTHVGSAKTIKELAERYANDPRVNIQVLDNSHGKDGVRLGSIDAIPALEYTRVRGDLDEALEQAYRSGAISEAVYRGTKGQDAGGPGPRGPRPPDRSGGGGKPEAPPARQEVSAADRAASASPQVREAALRTAVGQLADGRPVNVEPLFASDPRAVAEAAARQASALDPDAPRQAEQAAAIDKEIAESNTALEAAEKEAVIAEDALRAQAKLYELEPTDEAIEAAQLLTKQAERWSRMAQAAINCLIRGA